MEQEPQRELKWYTLQSVAYWVRVSGKLLFILLSLVIMISAFIVLATS